MESQFGIGVLLGSHFQEHLIGFFHLLDLPHPVQPGLDLGPLLEGLSHEHQELDLVIGAEVGEGGFAAREEVGGGQIVVGYGLESPLHILLGLGLHELGVGGDAHVLGEQAVEDVERALPGVRVVEVQVLVDLRPLHVALRRVPIPDMLRVLVAQVPHYSVAFGQLESVLGVHNGRHFGHGVNLPELLGSHFQFADPNFGYFNGDLADQTQGPDSPRGLGHVVDIQLDDHPSIIDMQEYNSVKINYPSYKLLLLFFLLLFSQTRPEKFSRVLGNIQFHSPPHAGCRFPPHCPPHAGHLALFHTLPSQVDFLQKPTQQKIEDPQPKKEKQAITQDGYETCQDLAS